jgi:hypothetical protein
MEELTRRQQLAIVELLKGQKLDDVAKAVKINPSTLDVWLRLPAFRAELNAALDRAFEDAFNQVTTHVQKAFETCLDVLEDPDSANRDRLKAASLIIDNVWRRRELRLEDRIAVLEEQLMNGTP